MLLVNKLMVSPALDISRRGAAIRELDLEIAMKYPRDRASSSTRRAQTSSCSIGRNRVSDLSPAFKTDLEAIVKFDPATQPIPV
jgi:hypothetical protein